MRLALRIGETDIVPARIRRVEVAQTVDAETDTLTATVGADGSPLPSSGVRAEAWFDGSYMGGYVVSDLLWRSGPQGTEIEVIATGADLVASGLRTPATRAWADGLTFAALFEQIARSHGYEPRVHADLAGRVLSHEDQIAESDLVFLERVCDRYDVDLRFSAGFALAVPRSAGATAGGLSLDRTLGAWEALEIRLADRWDFAAVEARYYDYEQGRPVVVRVGSSTGDAYQVRGVLDDADHARSVAERERIRLAERAWRLSATTPGDPALIPHTTLDLPSGAVPEGAPTRWRVLDAVHRVDDDTGFTTAIRATVPERPAERPQPPAVSKVTYSNVRYRDPDRDYRRLVDLGE